MATNKPLGAGAAAGVSDQTTESVTRTLFEDYNDDEVDDDDHRKDDDDDNRRKKDADDSAGQTIATPTLNVAAAPVAAAAAAATAPRAATTTRPAYLSDFFEVAQGLAESSAGLGRGHRSSTGAPVGSGSDKFSANGGGSSGGSGASLHWQDRLRAAKALPDALALYTNSSSGGTKGLGSRTIASASSLSSSEQECCRCAVDALLGDLHQKVGGNAPQ